MSESVILCEGYFDRAFWAGWLKHLGCEDPSTRGPVNDALGRPVSQGQFMYRSKSEKYIRIVPCGGKPQVREQARRQLGQRNMDPRLVRLVITVDPDVNAHTSTEATGLTIQGVGNLAREYDPQAAETADRDIAIDSGERLVSLVRWEAEDPPIAGVPSRQTLERLVCAAIVAAYPDRGPAVDTWLQSRPDPPPVPNPKEPAWSYMAGWYAEAGCEAFYRVIWDDPTIRAQLQARLTKFGAWRVAEVLAE